MASMPDKTMGIEVQRIGNGYLVLTDGTKHYCKDVGEISRYLGKEVAKVFGIKAQPKGADVICIMCNSLGATWTCRACQNKVCGECMDHSVDLCTGCFVRINGDFIERVTE